VTFFVGVALDFSDDATSLPDCFFCVGAGFFAAGGETTFFVATGFLALAMADFLTAVAGFFTAAAAFGSAAGFAGGLGGAAFGGAAAAPIVAGLRYVGRMFDARLAHISETASEARDAAKSANKEIKNNHDTNVRDDLDKAIETVWVVSDQIGALSKQVTGLLDQGARMEATLNAHSESLSSVQARVGRIDERGSKMAAELHDERTARESSQRTIDEHAHDAHARLHERLDRLQEKVDKWEERS